MSYVYGTVFGVLAMIVFCLIFLAFTDPDLNRRYPVRKTAALAKTAWAHVRKPRHLIARARSLRPRLSVEWGRQAPGRHAAPRARALRPLPNGPTYPGRTAVEADDSTDVLPAVPAGAL